MNLDVSKAERDMSDTTRRVPLLEQYKNFTTMLVASAIVIATLMLIQYHWRRRRLYDFARKLPGPNNYPALPLIGHAYIFAGSNERILSQMTYMLRTNKTPFKVWLGQRLIFAVTEPKHLEIILNHPKSLSKDDLYRFLGAVAGDGIFTAKVDKWRKHRRMIAPAFNQRILNDFVTSFAEQATILTEILRENTDKLIDVVHFTDRASLDVVCETSMGLKLNAQTEDTEFSGWVQRLLSIAYQRMVQVWYHPDFIFYNTPLGWEFKTLIKKFVDYTDKVITEKKTEYYEQKRIAEECPEAQTEETSKRKSFLDLLLQLTENEKFNNEQLRDEVNTFLVAGAEAMASTLSFALICLGMNPHLEEKVYEEVMEVLGSSREVEFSDLPKLKFTERFVNETHRLFPVAPIIVRHHDADIDLGDAVLPAGSSSVLGIMHAHTSNLYWPEPMKFDPDRFLPEQVAKRHPYCFMPFSAGPRACIGKKYANMFLVTFLAQLVREFKCTTPYKRIQDIRVKEDLILRPVEGYMVTLKLRE